MHDTASAAMYYFPDVFCRPRDEYVAAMIKELALFTNEEGQGLSAISCYLGNIHVKPTLRLLNTFNSDGVHSAIKTEDGPISHGRTSQWQKLRRSLKT